MYFSPNWITRGLTLVLRILPKFGEFTSGRGLAKSAVLGALNCEWLNKLKNSARNMRVWRSVILVVFIRVASKLNTGGPGAAPAPILPKSYPSPICGGAQKAFFANQSPVRAFGLPVLNIEE